MKKIAFTKGSWHGDQHILECCICHENDRDKLFVEDIGIAVGMAGKDYTFCKKCWKSKNLGDKILSMLDRSVDLGLKLEDEILNIKEVE